MVFRLLDLKSGNLSLEFEVDEIGILADKIRQTFGGARRIPQITYTEYVFGGATFIFQNEWEDPCLISLSPEGGAILRDLHEALVTHRN